MSVPESSAALWNQHARRALRRQKLAWWWQYAGPLAAGMSLLIMGVLLWLRSSGNLPAPELLIPVLAGLYLLAGGISWRLASRNFPKNENGLAVLEGHLRLNNALTAAARGVTSWPEAPLKVADGFRFRAGWLVVPVALSLLCLTLAFVLPVSEANAPPSLPPPLAATRAEALLEQLAKEEVADPAALEKRRDELEALMAQSPREWYQHHNLEAVDSLESALKEAAGNMGRNLEQAANRAEALADPASPLSPESRQEMGQQLQSALEGLRNSPLGTNENLEKQLSQLDPSKLKQLDPQQLEKMLQNLKAKAEACRNCQSGTCGTEGDAAAALARLLRGEGKDGMQKDDEPGSGQGGVERGPGTSPLTYEKTGTELDTNRLEQIESENLSRSLPGDHLGTSHMEHRLDKTPAGVSAGGSAPEASGGDAVWKTPLMPAEQKVLRRYFQ